MISDEQLLRGPVLEVITEHFVTQGSQIEKLSFRHDGTLERIVTRTPDGYEFSREMRLDNICRSITPSPDGGFIEQQRLELDTWPLPGMPDIAIGTECAFYAETTFDNSRYPIQTVFWNKEKNEKLAILLYVCSSSGLILSATQYKGETEQFRLEREYDRRACVLSQSLWFQRELTRRTVFSYNEHGDWITSTTTEQGGSTHTETSEYEYDSRGNWTKRLVHHLSGMDEYHRRIIYHE